MSPTVRDGRGKREVYEVGLVGSPIGAVERRQALDHEREGFAPRRPSPGLPGALPRHLTEPSLATPSPTPTPRRSPSARTCPHGLYGDVRCYVCDPLVPSRPVPAVALIRIADPPVTPPSPEEPPVAIDPAEPLPVVVTHDEPGYNRDALVGLQIATTEALDALVGLEEARQAETRWIAACKALEAAWRQTGLRGGTTSIDVAIGALKLGVELATADAERRHELLNGDQGAVPEGPEAAGIDPASERQPGDGDLDELPASTESSSDIPETIPVAERQPHLNIGAGPEPEDDSPEVVTRAPDAAARMAAIASDRASRVHTHDVAAGGGPGSIPPYQRRMLDALVAANGNVPAAAAAIGIKATSLTGTMGRLRKLNGLTDAERAVVARKR